MDERTKKEMDVFWSKQIVMAGGACTAVPCCECPVKEFCTTDIDYDAESPIVAKAAQAFLDKA
jgi:hypothetical protein